MPAKSKAQQRYFGYLLSNPDERKKEGVSRKVAREFAGTKHKGLPEKVKEGIDEGIGKALKKGLERDKKARQKKKEKEGRAVPYAMLAQEYIPENEGAPTMSTVSTSSAAGFSQDADASGPVAGLDQPLGGTQKQPRGKGCKKGRKFCTKKSKDGVNYVDSRVKSEGFKGQYKDKSKLSQSSQRKSLGRGASIKDGAKKRSYESPKEHRDTSKKLAKYQVKGTYNAHLGEGSSIIQGRRSSKKVSYRGPTGDHERNEKGWIKASHYKSNKKAPQVTATKKKPDTRKSPGFTPKTGEQRKDAVRRYDAYQKLKAKIHAKDDARKKKAQEIEKKRNPNYGKSHGGRKYVRVEGRQPDDAASSGNPRYLPFKVRCDSPTCPGCMEFIYYGKSPAEVKIELRKIYRPEKLNHITITRVYPPDVLKFYWQKRQQAM